MRSQQIASKRSGVRNRSRSDRGSSTYDVGYRRPPTHSRFKPGVSGNPGGRPKRPKLLDVHREIQKVFTKEMLVRNGDQTYRVPGIVAFVQKILVDAMRGDRKAMTLCYKIADDYNVLTFKEEPRIDLSVLTEKERARCLDVLSLIRKAGASI